MKPRKKKYGPVTKEFKPQNPDKYTGKWPILCRSSLEKKAMFTLDQNPAVVKWGSESVIIKYRNPVKDKVCRYYMDLDFIILDGSGKQVRYLVEVKPESQTHPPKRGRKQQKTILNEAATYAVNISKWRATKKFCDLKGWRFALWTEAGLRIWKED